MTRAASLTVELDGVSKRFENPDGTTTTALNGVDLVIKPGDFICLVGHNGSGKTTLQHLITGHLRPDSGRVLARSGSESWDWTQRARWERAQHLAHVRQDPAADTVPEMSVLDHCHLSALAASGRRASAWRRSRIGRDEAQLLDHLLTGAGLTDRRSSAVRELSQGQRQLLVVALALLRRPALLLLDEHTASLDRRNAAQCMEITEELVRELGTSVLMITHDLSAALRYGNRLVVLRDGQVSADLDRDQKCALSLEGLLRMTGLVE